MNERAIEVVDVGVRFRPYVDRAPTLRRLLGSGEGLKGEPVQALDGVTATVFRGEAFGVIGSNGSGKSTLLRVMARTLRPDAGHVIVHGRTSTLLQLGVGFNVELTGRRNIVLGGLANGLRLTDINDRMDSIIDFSELGEAIDRPVKTYSSGMFSRLAFAISVHLEPDILLLDEVLAVGDLHFQAKSMEQMQSLLARSGTIVFVSHSLTRVADFCDRALWLDGGVVRALGPASDVVAEYEAGAP